MKKFTITMLAGAMLLGVSQARADDSSAALGAGGLVLTQSADIRMAAEDLSISPKEVRVRFAFVNDSAKDVDTIVAFPLPDIDTYKFWGEAIGTTTSDPVNFVGFEVLSGGKRIPVEAEQRAIYKGRDVTDIVKSAGAPLNTVTQGASDRLAALPAPRMKILDAAGLVEHDDKNAISKWLLRTKFFWREHFPAGKTVILDQRYQPVTGAAFFGGDELKGGEDAQYWQKNFCLDAPTRGVIAAKIAAARKADAQNGGLLNAYSTDYVLVSGNNWKGPIGRFHLTVDKLKPDNVLSMCWDGELKKTGATTFEATQTNFAPRHDIDLLVLSSAPLD